MAKNESDRTALRQFKKELREGDLRRLYVFYGEESYLKEHYLEELKKRLIPAGLEQFNLHAIPGKECSPQALAQAVDCLPMMSERTLVLVTDLDLFGGAAGDREALAGLFADLPEYCCLVFCYDLIPYKADARTKLAAALKENGLTVEFARQERRALIDWISRHFRALDHDIAPGDAEYLLDLCGDLMTNLNTEIEKIGAYAAGRQITRADIDAVAVPQLEAVVFGMNDAIARGDFQRAAAVLSDLLGAQEAPVMILSVVGKYFRQLYTARLLLERRRGGRELMELWGMRSAWQADKLMDAARRYSLSWCRQAVARCTRADLDMKSGGGDERDLLVGLLMELAAGRAAP